MKGTLNASFIEATAVEATQPILAILLVIIIVVSAVANTLIMLGIYSDSRMQTPTNTLILSQSVADLGTTVFVIPCALISVACGGWRLGDIMCAVNAFLNMYLTAITVLNLTVIGIDRYFAIVHPAHHKISRKKAIYVVVFVWALALLPGLPLLALLSDKVILVYFPGFFVCGQEFLYPTGQIELGVIILICTLFVAIPLLVILFCFKKIFRVTRDKKHRICPCAMSNAQKIAIQVYAKSAYTSMYVIITSLLQVFPACFTMLLVGFQAITIPEGLASTFKIVMWSHCFVKPIIYAARQRYFSRRILNFYKSPCCRGMRARSFFDRCILIRIKHQSHECESRKTSLNGRFPQTSRNRSISVNLKSMLQVTRRQSNDSKLRDFSEI
ncbi:predicted protein [Nematostella vectensis]|uniref:G-protein coupled receptors family 1 profile domain-containing protein n=1 Tax=Nematostella vectensis TaxID=45351 RepID=A7RS56_NEMVE|nr:predicted protein [Nematostella vectensis]|eukprot:XP_001637811.1 predicted protein [Nematostella vectensis]